MSERDAIRDSLFRFTTMLSVRPPFPEAPQLADRLVFLARAIPCGACGEPMDSVVATRPFPNDVTGRYFACVYLCCSKHPERSGPPKQASKPA